MDATIALGRREEGLEVDLELQALQGRQKRNVRQPRGEMLFEQGGHACACGSAPGDVAACSHAMRGCLGDRTGAVAGAAFGCATRCEGLRASQLPERCGPVPQARRRRIYSDVKDATRARGKSARARAPPSLELRL